MANIKAIAEELVRLTDSQVKKLSEAVKEYGITAEEIIGKRDEGITFGAAIEAMKYGKRVARKGWNGKRMFLYYVSEGRYPVKMEAAKAIADADGLVSYGAYIAIKTAQGNVVPWLASQTDILSNDWMVVG